MQISEKERDVELSSLFKDVASIIAEKCINPKTQRPYTITMIERALRDCHFSVDPKRSAKQQALQARSPSSLLLADPGTFCTKTCSCAPSPELTLQAGGQTCHLSVVPSDTKHFEDTACSRCSKRALKTACRQITMMAQCGSTMALMPPAKRLLALSSPPLSEGFREQPVCVQAVQPLKEQLPIERARMRMKLQVPSSSREELISLLQTKQATIESQDLGFNNNQVPAGWGLCSHPCSLCKDAVLTLRSLCSHQAVVK